MVINKGFSRRRGAVALEFALVLALVAIVVLAALVALSQQVTTAIGETGDVVTDAADSTATVFN